MAVHGDNGKLSVTKNSLAIMLRCSPEELKSKIISLPNILVNDNDGFTVIIKNWIKYQKDSTVYTRLKRYRKNKMITVDDNVINEISERKEEKEEERKKVVQRKKEEEREEKKEYNTFAQSQIEKCLKENNGTFEKAYPALNIAVESSKALAWLISNPQNKKSNIKRFLNNWFAKAQDRKNLYPPKEEKYL